MTNHTDQFNGNLKLVEGYHQIDGIGSGIAIKGVGTFKFRLEDDDGQVHTIRVPNLLRSIPQESSPGSTSLGTRGA